LEFILHFTFDFAKRTCANGADDVVLSNSDSVAVIAVVTIGIITHGVMIKLEKRE